MIKVDKISAGEGSGRFFSDKQQINLIVKVDYRPKHYRMPRYLLQAMIELRLRF
ncbi:MAG: hypothetical protein UY81_C0043G0002 [Candidatus Giovannonibacteria bacterium GW2011_GWA2_53_7]|uniref:Uncharacterized protein n=1 Tax=Candidatus Giovannonibacteria bacterium GW2011_GWA2_53_7 TaxID=1618650 RepID=A0A0G1XWQ8_9BACT|nr:MAG: hypothetical protein UY81_C0043G0002 [Candidatus Giovannonibacteria bacterium GW2011_GWA2_53_7]